MSYLSHLIRICGSSGLMLVKGMICESPANHPVRVASLPSSEGQLALTILLLLIRLLDTTMCTLMSMPADSCGYVSDKNFRDSVSAIGMSVLMCVKVRSYITRHTF